MKRLLALMLALCVLLAALPALAESAETAALPQTGDVVEGFEVIETRDFPLVGAQIVRFEHQKTGAELYYIANDDPNRAFDLSFFTDAIDNTGLPHVFEHATTAGSEKYPSSALWFNLVYQTYNTYLNATTDRRVTSYPIASLSEAQLLKLADYYADCCLHPILMDEERIYRTEAWRYRLASPEDELSIEGTVYSEMLGATALARAALSNALRAAFPGSLVGNDSGGEPAFIPDMTWDMLKNYHDLYYHPSNCAAYLYGQFEDYAAFLKLLDGYFSAYDRREFNHTDDGYTPITEPVTQAFPFPVEQGSSTEHAACIIYQFVCPGLNQDGQQEILMNTMTDLLTDPASNLQQQLKEALPYGQFGTYIEQDGPEDAICFFAQNVNAEDAETFRQIVDAALADVAENGFPQDLVDGVMTSLSISALLTREAHNVGVEAIIPSLANYYANTGDPWGYPEYIDGMSSMDDWNRQGLYAQAAADWLTGSQTTALVTTYPQPGLKEQNDAALAEKLAGIKAAMSEDEIAALVEATNAEPPEDDASELVAQLQAVTVESLPEEIKLFDVSDETDDAGVRHIDAVAGVDGIGMTSLFLNIDSLPQEDIHWMNLYAGLVGNLDTTAHTRAELAALMSRYLYDQQVYISLPCEGEDGYHPYLRLRWTGLDDDLAAGYDLMRELLFDTKVDDPQRLLEQVQSAKAALKTTVTSNPASLLMRRAAATTSEQYRYNTYAVDLEYYTFLEDVEALLTENPDAAVAKLQGVQAFLNNRAGAVALFAGNEASIALNRELSDAFFASLDSRVDTPATYDLPVPANAEALVIDSGVQYNLLLAGYDALGIEYDGGLNALTSLVDDVILVPQLRDGYGVYSPQHGAFDDLGVYLYAYRDPNIAETFDLCGTLADQVGALEVDPESLNGYILSAYAEFAEPVGELVGALEAATNVLEGKAQDRRLAWMRQLKQVTPEAVHDSAGLYAKLRENGVWMTAGPASAINANADLFEAILNPFGAVDATQVAFDDVPEDHPLYSAVRFAFENGFMAPLSEGTFGAEEPATNGDLLAAMYVAIGGGLDAGEALETFAEYGLVPADTDLDGAMDPADAGTLMSAMAGEEIPPLIETADPAAATRAELAAMLEAFLGA